MNIAAEIKKYTETDDIVLVIDTLGEARKAVEELGGEIVRFGKTFGAGNRINPLELYPGDMEGKDDPLYDKKLFLYNLCAFCCCDILREQEERYVNLATEKVYAKYLRTLNPDDLPTIRDFCRELCNPEYDWDYHRNLGLCMGIFFDDLFDWCNEKTNIHIQGRLVCISVSNFTSGFYAESAKLLISEYCSEYAAEKLRNGIKVQVFKDYKAVY